MEKYYEEDEARRLGIPYKTKAQLFLEHLAKSSNTESKPLSPDASRWKPLSEVLPVVQERVENKTDEWEKSIPTLINKPSSENDRKSKMLADRGASALEGLNTAFDSMYNPSEMDSSSQFRMPGLTDVEESEPEMPDSTESKPIDFKQQFINKYRKPKIDDSFFRNQAEESKLQSMLLQNKAENDLLDGLFEAASRAGAAIGRVKYDPTAAESLKKMSESQQQSGQADLAFRKSQRQEAEAKKDRDIERRLSQLNLQNVEELNDPNSKLSQLFQQALVRMGLTPPEGLAPAQVIKGLPLIQQASAIKSRQELAEEKKEEKANIEKLRAEENDNKFIQKAQNDIEKAYETYSKVRNASSNINKAIERIAHKKTKPGSEDVGILYQFIKGFDPTSVVREGEIELGKSAESALAKAGIFVKNLTTGDLLSKDFRKSAATIVAALSETAKNDYLDVISPRIELARSRGINEDRIKRELDIGKVFYPQESTKPSTISSSDEKSKKNLDIFMKNNPSYSQEDAVKFLKSKGMYR